MGILQFIKSLLSGSSKCDDCKNKESVKPPATFLEAVDRFKTIIENFEPDDRNFLLGVENAPTFTSYIHHGVGRWIRNNWNLWEQDSPLLNVIFKEFGIRHADDVSSLIAMCAWQKMKGEEITPVEWAKGFKEYWEMNNCDVMGYPLNSKGDRNVN